jgi:NADPH:quinone reductase-like Zn-dependent oxidoreductase
LAVGVLLDNLVSVHDDIRHIICSYQNLSVIQLAKLSGLSPIITTASLKHTDLLKSLGATNVIDRNASLSDEVRKITDQPITIVYDSISSAETQQAGLNVLAPRGTIAVITPPTIKSDEKEILRIMGHLSTPAYVELF